MACDGLLAGALEPLEQVAAALAERVDHGVAGVAERARDVLALLGQRVGDPPRCLVDLLGDELADLGDVVAEIEMHAVDGVADLLGLADQRVALAAQILEQAADAHFVVVVGALERGDLVGDQRLELGGARQRALDAVAHGGDLAADRLADGDDRLARDRLRLGEPHGDLGHRLGDEPQLLRAPHHVGEHVEEDDRREEDRRPSTAEHRRGQAGRAERGLQFGQVEPAEHEAGEHPERRRTRSRRRRRSAPDGAAALRRIWPIDSRSSLAGRRTALGLFGRCGSVVEQVLAGRRRLTHGAPRLLRRPARLGRVTGGGGGLPALARRGVSAHVSASWIADSAASVGSFIFFGVFAMSVVASYYAGPEPRPDDPDRATSALALRSPPEPPRAAGSNAPHRHSTAVRLSYRLGKPKETAC